MTTKLGGRELLGNWRSVIGAPNSQSLTLRWALLQGGVLLILALGSGWLLLRGDSIEQRKLVLSRGRSLVELVAHGASGSLDLQDPSRLLRLLECATRDGGIEAAAVIDGAGTVRAHTDLNRQGSDIAAWSSAQDGTDGENGALRSQLFGAQDGLLLLHPILGEKGEMGSVVFLLPRTTLLGGSASVLPFFLPAALLILAFFVIGQTALRHAVQPTSEFLEKLTATLGQHAALSPSDLQLSQALTDPLRPTGNAMEDTVDRVQALARLRDELIIKTRLVDYEKKRMEQILDTFPDGLVVGSFMGDVVFINRRAQQVLGFTGRREDVKSVSDLPQLQLLAHESEKTAQVMLPEQLSGPDRHIVFNRIPLSVAESKAGHVLFTLRDVTAQHAAQRTQSEFLSQISHELKAPLNSIVTFVEELAEDDELTREQRKEYCNILDREANRMAQLINNLLQLSRIQLGNLSAQFSFVKTAALVKEQAESLRRHAQGNGLELVEDVPDNLPPLSGDKDLLGVALNNLISNAIKYTPAKGRIAVSVREEQKFVVISVEDTGIGIAPEQHEKVFERFYRSEDEKVQEKQGSGLGLALAKEIIEVHGGSITLRSELGHGSEFRISLPAREVGARLESMESGTPVASVGEKT